MFKRDGSRWHVEVCNLGRDRGRILPWLLLVLGVGGGGLLAGWVIYMAVGKTPGELLDYVEHRLIGHPKLEWLALPVMTQMREALGAPTVEQRKQTPFVVPPPPKLSLDAGAAGMTNDAAGLGRVLRVGRSRDIPEIAMAARMAKDGDIVEIDAGNYYGDVALWNQKRLTIRGVGGRVRLHAAGRSAEGKGIWVIRNGEFDVSNIEFVGAKVHDRNGAGIRFEGGYLRISHCLFWANENGILTSSGDGASKTRLDIEDCEFGYNGNGDGLSHGIYVGRIERLRITGSYFHHGNVGHLVKSRARITELFYNRITDETGGRASYEVDIPNGGVAVLIGNIIQQTRETENSTMISYGREGYFSPENRLYLANNTLVNDHPHGGAYLRVGDGPVSIVSVNNLLSGVGKYHANANVTEWNDVRGSWELFERPTRFDYRLNSIGRQKRYESPPQVLADRGVIPERQFNSEIGIGSLPLQGVPAYPGALQ